MDECEDGGPPAESGPAAKRRRPDEPAPTAAEAPGSPQSKPPPSESADQPSTPAQPVPPETPESSTPETTADVSKPSTAAKPAPVETPDSSTADVSREKGGAKDAPRAQPKPSADPRRRGEEKKASGGGSKSSAEPRGRGAGEGPSRSGGRRRVAEVRARLRSRLEELLAPERAAECPALQKALGEAEGGWVSLRELNRHFGPLLLGSGEGALLEEERRSLADVCAGSDVVETAGLRVRRRPDAVPKEQRTLFVDGLRPSAGAEWLKAQFSPCGLLTHIHVPPPRTPRPRAQSLCPAQRRSVVSQNRGFAFLTFASTAALQRALLLNSRPPEDAKAAEQPMDQGAQPSEAQAKPAAGREPGTSRQSSGREAGSGGGGEAMEEGQPSGGKKKARGRSRAEKTAARRGTADLRHRRETLGLWLLPHSRWAALKAEYRALQKAAASRLKAAVPAAFRAPLSAPASADLAQPRTAPKRGRDQLARRAAAFRAASSLPAPHRTLLDLDGVD